MTGRIIALAMFGALMLSGTSSATSIFSFHQQGVGYWAWSTNARLSAMGGTGTAVYDEMNPIGQNPATIAAFERASMTASFLSQRRSATDDVSSTAIYYDQSPRVLRAVIPMFKGFVIGAGLEPISDTVIRWASKADDVAGMTLLDSLEASGGLWAGTLEIAREFGPISIGAQVRAVRGNLETEWRRTILESGVPLATSELLSRRYRGSVYGLGVVYRIGETARSAATWTLGASLDLPASIDEDQTLSRGTRIPLWYLPEHNEAPTVAPDLNDTTSSTVDLPLALTLGATWNSGGRLLAAADVGYTRWSTLSDAFADTWRAGVGVEVHPSTDFRSFVALQWPYRFGARWEQHYIPSPVDHPSAWYLSTGFGVPIGGDRGQIDYSFEYGRRGTIGENGVTERVWRQTISIVGWERWFEYRPRR